MAASEVVRSGLDRVAEQDVLIQNHLLPNRSDQKTKEDNVPLASADLLGRCNYDTDKLSLYIGSYWVISPGVAGKGFWNK